MLQHRKKRGDHNCGIFCLHVQQQCMKVSWVIYYESSNFTPQVKEARNQPQIFIRKSISRNIMHRQSYDHIQIET